MTKSKDIRWLQSFDNYTKVLEQLSMAVSLANERKLSKLEEQGLIQSFEYTHELAWNTLKDFLIEQGNRDMYGSRAKGNYRIGSDIDLTIIGTDIDLSKLNEIENRLDDLMLPYSFDISVFSHIKNDGLLDHIKHVGKEFYIKRN